MLVYENERDFCVLILYPTVLQNFLISSRSFLLAFLGFSINMYSMYSGNCFTTLFSNLNSFSFSLIAVARTYETMLNNSALSWHPCLVTDFRGNAFSFQPLRIILAVGLLYMAFVMLR